MNGNNNSSGLYVGAYFYLDFPAVQEVRQKKLLVLSIGYGQGHHAAAAAVQEHYAGQGWRTRVADVCELAQPGIFRLTQYFYDFCVRRAPWLWGVTYSLTDTADWSILVRNPLLGSVLACLRDMLHEEMPDLVVCTYPLFAYMLDELQQRGECTPPYTVLVTDSLEISRPWMRSRCPLVLLPDAYSCSMVRERYGLGEEAAVAVGFPVREAFAPSPDRVPPGPGCLRIVYGAYRQTGGVLADICALLDSFPQLRLTVIAGRRCRMLRRYFEAYCEAGRLEVFASTTRMPELLAESHFYVGKAGAATMFECYAAQVPVLVNYTLPGQERGNLDLLLRDGAGCHVESTAHLIATVQGMLRNGAQGWMLLCAAMLQVGRSGCAARVAQAVTKKYGI